MCIRDRLNSKKYVLYKDVKLEELVNYWLKHVCVTSQDCKIEFEHVFGICAFKKFDYL